jgi:Tfp pilus assembly protein PilF
MNQNNNFIKEYKPPLWMVLFFLSAMSVLGFLESLENDIVSLDDPEILSQSMIRAFTLENWREMITSFKTGNWIPVVWISFAIDYKLFGLAPWGYHLTSILIHGFNVCLVFFLFFHITQPLYGRNKAYWGGAIAALLFGVHPLRVESVVWIAERKDLLCAFFYLLVLTLYVKWMEVDKKSLPKIKYFVLLVFFALSLMSKPMAVSLPIILILLDIHPLNRIVSISGFWTSIREKFFFFILSLIIGLTTIQAQKQVGAMEQVYRNGLSDRLMNSIHNVFFYVQKTFWPQSLSPLYPFQEPWSPFSGWFIISIIFFSGVTLFCIKAWKDGNKISGIAWLSYLIILMPVSGFVQVGSAAAADRYSYLPTIPIFFLMIGSIITVSLDKTRHILIGSLFCLIFISIFYLTQRQIEVWKNSENFWARTIKFYPGSIPLARRNYARALLENGRFEKAENQLKIALKISPKNPDILSDLGYLYIYLNRVLKAETYLKAALEVNPFNLEALINMGTLEKNKKQLGPAQIYFRRALQINKSRFDVYNHLGEIFIELRKYKDAEFNFKKAIALNSVAPDIHLNLGKLYLNSKKYKDAERETLIALKEDPAYLEARINLGDIYLKMKFIDRAKKEYQKALKIDPTAEKVIERLSSLTLALKN